MTQTRPGVSPLGRTVGLVAATAAEYRVLGANEPVLASIRAAGGGTAIVSPLDPWRHDLRVTDRFTELWPLLLVLASLLWPLDIALRRLSLGRRELAAVRGWVTGIGRRRAATAPRTATGQGLLAARDRAGSTEARAAILGASEPTPSGPSSPPAATRPVTVAPPPALPAGSGSPASDSRAPEQPAASPDTLERLREAKRRARDR